MGLKKALGSILVIKPTRLLLIKINCMGFPGGTVVTNLPAMRETWVWALGWEDPLVEGMSTHSSILAWRIPMNRGAWRATGHGVTKSWTWLSDWACIHKRYTWDIKNQDKCYKTCALIIKKERENTTKIKCQDCNKCFSSQEEWAFLFIYILFVYRFINHF